MNRYVAQAGRVIPQLAMYLTLLAMLAAPLVTLADSGRDVTATQGPGNTSSPWSVSINGTPIVSGTVTISGTPYVIISGTPFVQGTVTSNQGAPAPTSSAWPVQVIGTPIVSVNGTPTVLIQGTPWVQVSGTPPVNLMQVGGSNLVLGQASMASSIPVAPASNYTPPAPTGTATVVQAPGSTATVAQGAPGSTSSPWPVVSSPTGTASVTITNTTASPVPVGPGANVTVFATPTTITATSTASVELTTSVPHGVFIVNNGATPVYIGDSAVVSGATAASHGGFMLAANGGSVTLSPLQGFTGPIYAITASGSTVVAVWPWLHRPVEWASTHARRVFMGGYWR